MNQNTPTGQPNTDSQDYTQPVAYDNQGRPLYAHPPHAQNQPQEYQKVYMTRPLDPSPQEVPAIIQQRHEESVEKYPGLNLSVGEYVIAATKRHPIGLIQIWGTLTIIALIFLALFGAFIANPDSSPITNVIGSAEQTQTIASIALGGFIVLLGLGGLAATYIYNGNRFYLTNESVIQEIQNSLFSKHEQTVSLSNVEDASYRQTNLLQQILNYGSIRLSTEGDETTYRFSYVANPKKHIAVLNNAVEAFKNGRPVHGQVD
jgi:uncharacterized membrane protein YdbT with pleckstrin-like domain